MIQQQQVIHFFDRLAPQWDADMIRNDEIISMILDGAGVGAGQQILDVACGTGVLIGDYLNREVAHVTGIDISPEMVRIARGKFSPAQVTILEGAAETFAPEERYDVIMIYNAFPHFPDPDALISHLSGLLKPGGRLSVAHGMSRAMIDRHHEGSASKVSLGLMHEDNLAAIFSRYLTVTLKRSDDRMYQVVGIKD